ncbi:MAG: capsid protein [CRESS virus sp. ct1Gc25]|nr:MAG: capsid protein [CRESS virus sp. ct1Gc25]
MIKRMAGKRKFNSFYKKDGAGVKKYKGSASQQNYIKREYVPRTPGGAVVSELKVIDSFLANTVLSAPTSWANTEVDPATLNCLFAPGPGTGLNQRIGRKVSVKKLKVRGLITCASQVDQTTPDNGCQVRLIFYQDMQTNGAQSQGEDLMDTPTASVQGVFNSFQNTASFGRFRVLKDMCIEINNPNISWDGTNLEQQGIVKRFKFSKVFKEPVVVHYNATGGTTVADVVDNSFHAIAVVNSAALVPNLSYVCRVTYTDV